ncbi:serine hydrolase domain-containing protein [Gluconacetobacter sacchari]|uniref:Beta-lactamase family protein n=2 Tax=Gluconacetobacter sacchari TaxID=92759 RepID=A0A7W4IG43_9PROT|nr:serine hydrolase domain-containing protein [Gluconacetobacter sacchari]MBB2162220.1 beta-lactamase family protein [Gluconacetobacter sacchari]GBQ30225.1 beta-lactamase [Gluconacetobacter sacchari DSM 12717]
MHRTIKTRCDALLADTVTGAVRVPGVVAMVTDRRHTFYEGAAGERLLGGGTAMTTDTVFRIFSCTKAIAGVAVMQLVEDGRLDLDAPAKIHVPELGAMQVVEGFDENGIPKLRPPKRDITTRMLMLHTAGFGYDFFNEPYRRLAESGQLPSIVSATKASITAPLLFDPGERWNYGVNIDWAGQVVERITGTRLGEVLRERIFAPLGMDDTGFTLTPSMRGRLATLHQRAPDGTLTPLPDFELPQEPELHMAGHGLYSTVGDYMRFIRMILDDGKGEHGRVLSAQTVAAMARNGLGALKITPLEGVIPTLSNNAEFFPGLSKSWGYSFMINDEAAPTGRAAGALGWAGLANLFYWIDRRNGLGGFWATQILPFADGPSFNGFMDFETTVYDLHKS